VVSTPSHGCSEEKPVRAVVVPERGGSLKHREIDRPRPDDEEVLIAVEACGVCGGDTAVTEGRPAVEYPRVPGHEIAGTVVDIGRDVRGIESGDRVAVGWHGGHCFDCRQCRNGDFVTCRERRVTGVHHDGGYATHAVAPATAVAPVPDEVTLRDAAPLACAGLTAYTALARGDAPNGGTVAVVGIGGVGHMCVQFADAFGYETVALSRGPDKRAAALELGADRFVDTTDADPAAVLHDHGGADLILATAPDSGAVESVVDGLAPNGDLVVVGAPTEPVSVAVPPMLGNRWSLHGWSAGHAGDIEAVLRAAARNEVAPWVEPFPLAEAPAAFEAMRAGEVRFRAVLTP
jgi:NADPH2:quinone reductase